MAWESFDRRLGVVTPATYRYEYTYSPWYWGVEEFTTFTSSFADIAFMTGVTFDTDWVGIEVEDEDTFYMDRETFADLTNITTTRNNNSNVARYYMWERDNIEKVLFIEDTYLDGTMTLLKDYVVIAKRAGNLIGVGKFGAREGNTASLLTTIDTTAKVGRYLLLGEALTTRLIRVTPATLPEPPSTQWESFVNKDVEYRLSPPPAPNPPANANPIPPNTAVLGRWLKWEQVATFDPTGLTAFGATSSKTVDVDSLNDIMFVEDPRATIPDPDAYGGDVITPITGSPTRVVGNDSIWITTSIGAQNQAQLSISRGTNYATTTLKTDVRVYKAVTLLASANITSTNPASLTEENLNTATVTVTLSTGTYSASIATTNFELPTKPVGTTINSVSRTNDTVAVLTLAYDGTDFDVNAQLSVKVLATGHSGDEDLFTPAVVVTSTVETPAKPTGLTITSGNTRAVLRWNDPEDTDITGWQIQRRVKTSPLSAWPTVWTTVTPTDTTVATVKYKSLIVTGLTNGITYQYRVRALEGIGVSVPSDLAEVTPAIPKDPPSKPAILPHGIRVGTSIHTYSWIDVQPLCRYSQGYAAGEIINKFQYQSSGTTDFSSATWIDVPILSAYYRVDGDTFADRTAIISPYTVRSDDGDTTTFNTRAIRIVRDLTTRRSYIRIRAVNDNGNSPASNSVETGGGSMSSTPDMPENLTVTNLSIGTSVRLKWNNPNNPTIDKYQYQQSTSSAFTGATWTDVGSSSATTTQADITGLTTGTLYYFRIRSVNNYTSSSVPFNRSAVSQPSGSVNTRPALSKPLKPTGLSATAVNSSTIRLKWTNPNNSTITKYQYQQSTSSTFGSTWTDITSTSTTIQADIGSLSASTQYYFRIRAVNASGESPASDSANATTSPALPKPSKPLGFSATAQSATVIRLAWTNPSDNSISKYQYQQSTSSAFTGATWTDITSTATTVQFDVTGLTASTQYYFRIRAVNASGNSPNSDSANATTTAAVPAKPTGLTTISYNANFLQWVIGWDNPNDASITSYDLQEWQPARNRWANSSFLSTDLSNNRGTVFTGGVVNRVRIRAVNAVGNSPWSDGFDR